MEGMLNVTKSAVSHPYYPAEAEIVGYLANEYSTPVLLAFFAGGCAAISALTLSLVNRGHRHLSTREKATILWFVLSGCIHFFFEGYFALNHSHMGPTQHIFGQLWKEYAFSDSRYLTSDPFVLCMESVTAIMWGPLCFVVAGLIATSHPLRHALQTIVSLGQIYGDVLYYATCIFNLHHKGLNYSRPEAIYFWGYFVFINFIWIVIPGRLLYESVNASAAAFRALDKSKSQLRNEVELKKTS